ncbi:MAG: 6-bladed beta-propeller [Sulfurimonas sp.]|nr:6-bladed beta-propeller [Sulfurimonas sp.]
MSKNFLKVYMCIVVLILFSACAPKNIEKVKIVIPPPPNEPKVFYETSYRGDSSFATRSALDAFIGEEISFTNINLVKPYGVAAFGDSIYVSDTARAAVFDIDEKLKKVSLIGAGSPGKLSLPVGIAVGDEGNIYVADSKSSSILVYDKNKNFLNAFGGRLELARPTGISINNKDKILYVVDTKAHNIKAYSLAGKLLFTFGKRGVEESEFNFPTNIAVDRRNGNLAVVDTQNFRVQVFDKDGNFIRKFGKLGDRQGMFARPKGIGIDSDGNIYVSDSAFNNVQVFNDEGELLIFFGSSGNQIGQFSLIAGLHVDKYDRIYVVDSFNRRVAVYQYISEPWKKHNPIKYKELKEI